MKLCGLQKTTLLDYPGHVAATVFLGGCNFRCPYCHNSQIIGGDSESIFTKEEIFDFFKKRKGILEGICITGGEPTLDAGLEAFLKEIKELGYLIKLDTNGYRPEILKDLAGKRLLDYVAMDIKAGRKNYANASGVPGIKIRNIEESAAFLKSRTIPYEFRTTVVKGIHSLEDFKDIGRWLAGPSSYFLQNYVDSDQVLCPGNQSFSKEELETFLGVLKPYMPKVSLRGEN